MGLDDLKISAQNQIHCINWKRHDQCYSTVCSRNIDIEFFLETVELCRTFQDDRFHRVLNCYAFVLVLASFRSHRLLRKVESFLLFLSSCPDQILQSPSQKALLFCRCGPHVDG